MTLSEARTLAEDMKGQWHKQDGEDEVFRAMRIAEKIEQLLRKVNNAPS